MQTHACQWTMPWWIIPILSVNNVAMNSVFSVNNVGMNNPS